MIKNKTIGGVAIALALSGSLVACSSDSNSKKDSHDTTISDSAQKSDNSSTKPSVTSSSTPTLNGEEGIVNYSQYKFNQDGGKILDALSSTPLWATKYKFIGTSEETAVITNENDGSNNIYQGVDLNSGKVKWTLKLDTPPNLKQLKGSNNAEVTIVGKTLIAQWGGTIGGDALHEAQPVTYAQAFDVNSGKSIGEARENVTGLSLQTYGVAHTFNSINDPSTKNSSSKVFYGDQVVTEALPDHDKLQASVGDMYSNPIDNIMLTTPGKGLLSFTKQSASNSTNSDNYYQAFDSKTNHVVGSPIKCSYAASGTAPIYSPDGDKMVFGNLVVDVKNPTKMRCLDFVSKDRVAYRSIDDEGNLLGIASASGNPSWVYVPGNSNNPKILDQTRGGASTEVLLTNSKIIKMEGASYSTTPNAPAVWSGQWIVSNRKK